MSLWHLCCFLFLLPLLYVCFLTFFFLIRFCLHFSAIFALFIFLFVFIVFACFECVVCLFCSSSFLPLPLSFASLLLNLICYSFSLLICSLSSSCRFRRHHRKHQQVIAKSTRNIASNTVVFLRLSVFLESFRIARCRSRKPRKRHRSRRPAFCNLGRPPRRLDFATSAGRRRPHAHPIA